MVELLCKEEILLDNTQVWGSYDYYKVVEWSTCGKETVWGDIDDNWAQWVYDMMTTGSIFDTKVLEWKDIF